MAVSELYIKYDSKPPYLPIAVAESKTELAKKLGVRPNVVYSAFSHGQKTYAVVKVADEEEMGKHKKIPGMWERIDEVIADSGLSKIEISKRCGFERRTLSGETENRMLSIGALKSFCQTMNVSADYILGIKKEKTV